MDRNTSEAALWEWEEQAVYERLQAEHEIQMVYERRQRRQAELKMQAERERRRKKMRQKRRKRQQRIRLIVHGVILSAALMALTAVGKHLFQRSSEWMEPEVVQVGQTGTDADVWQAEHELVKSGNGETIEDYSDMCGLSEVDPPVKREPWEVLERLGELAEGDARIAEIFAKKSSYPDKMLEALANNPEMADFVAGCLEASPLAGGGITENEKEQAFPLFLQWDPRWGYVSYGDDSNIGLAGCGPTCLSMALYYLTRDGNLTPDRVAEYSMDNGYYMPGTGTQWALIDDVPRKYGLTATKPGISESIMKRELDAGSVMICAMRQGDFTASGHFIVIYGYDENGFLVNDPNCVARSRKSWTFETLKGQIKQLWSIA